MTVDDALSFADRMYTNSSFAGVLAAEVRRLREENERLRVQLAGCGVAAMQNTADSRAHRINRDDYGWSASYADVCSAVDREISLREENERLRAVLESACEKMKQCRYVEARSDMLQAIDAVRGGK